MIHAVDIVKHYPRGGDTGRAVLDGVSLDVESGTFCAVLGPSGSGKSTLLRCLSGLESLDSGRVEVGGQDVTSMEPKAMARFRREDIAFVFQEYNLVSDLTLRENIGLDLEMTADVQELGRKWGIGHVLDQFPAECSGGQQQKAALLRALNKGARVLFCDEPTGALDAASTGAVLTEIQTLVRRFGTTVLMITHNELVTEIADLVIRLHDGAVAADAVQETPRWADEVEW